MDRRLPHEGEAQDGVLLAWPHPDSDWAPYLQAAEAEFAMLAAAIAAYQKVVVLCRDETHRKHIRDRLTPLLEAPHRLHLHCLPYDDTWVRDYAPLTVYQEGRPILVDFRFDGWGGKYSAQRDDRVGRGLHEAGAFAPDIPVERHDWVLEGGAVETDGQGTLLVNAPCLLDPRRNPGLDRREAEARLRRTLGAHHIHWLEIPPLQGDDTDGHIDTLARYADPHTLLYSASEDPGHPDHRTLCRLEEALRRLTSPDGRFHRLIPLPLPRPMEDGGRPLPANYTNFLLLPAAVLVPQYGDRRRDEQALEHIASAFPGRAVVGIPSATLIRQNGSLHCLTMQLPRGTLLPCPAA